ncbi:hypothetical protein EWM64_g7727 [Hericium alpestre]|uniref:Uncharacterized protein n=1 Tax=Hericium alpestre TaxID=135208 RepID=A0A4Y9ZQH2_9AGAM|nr:hypothetical protein EWM64_g7727 [Hericium alpestre]
MARLWTSSIIYGIYSMLFAGSIYVLLKQRPNKLFLVGSIVLFILTTAIAILFFLESLLRPVATSMSTFTDGATVPCSQLQIFRCTILWGAHKWIVALPTFLLLASTVCNLTQVYYDARICVLAYRGISMSSAPSVAMAVAATRVSDAATSLSLAMNVLTSFLVALKIWRMTKSIESVLGKKAGLRYRAIIAVFVESGAFFSASLAAELAVTFSSVPMDISDGACDIQAITPTLVIVRVGMGAGFDNVHETFNLSDASHIVNAALHRDRPMTMLSAMHFASVQETSVVNSESGGGEYELEKALKSSAV